MPVNFYAQTLNDLAIDDGADVTAIALRAILSVLLAKDTAPTSYQAVLTNVLSYGPSSRSFAEIVQPLQTLVDRKSQGK